MGNSWDNKATSPAFTNSVTTPSTTVYVFNETATTVHAFGAATTINFGASNATLNVGGVAVTASTRGTVTQTGSISTSVTINKTRGTITTVSNSYSANTGEVFNVTNSEVTILDVIECTTQHYGGSVNFTAQAFEVQNGSFSIRVLALGSTTASIVVNFKVTKTD